jgi:hypothetical protein
VHEEQGGATPARLGPAQHERRAGREPLVLADELLHPGPAELALHVPRAPEYESQGGGFPARA